MTPDGRSFHRALASGLIALAACGNTADGKSCQDRLSLRQPNSKADGSEKAWSQGQIFRINGSNATLFAVWTPHP